MKIFGWLADHAGCGWYRVVLPLEQLRRHGVETVWASRMHSSHWESDIIVAQRTCLPGATQALQRIVRHKGKRPAIVMELDDDLWRIDQSNPLSKGFYTDPTIRNNLTKNIEVADAVTVSTQPLAEIVSRWNKNVHVLPNTVPTEMFSWMPGRYLDRVTVGWQGSPTHDGDWLRPGIHLQRAFERVAADMPAGVTLEMHTVGEIPKHFPEVTPHRHSPWQEDLRAYYRLLDWDIALAPLADTPFNHSKSDIRVLEAAMLGFPVIASSVTAYRDAIQHGTTGFLVENYGEWGKWLRLLAHEPASREEMSAAARKWAATRAIDRVAPKWLEVYRGLVG